jgi:hypothetical protein
VLSFKPPYLSVYDVAVSVRHPSLCVKAIDKACLAHFVILSSV